MSKEKENKKNESKETLDLKKVVEERNNLLKEKDDQYLRLRADFENFKKRWVAEREEIIHFANEVLIISLLPVLDNFERAVDAIDSLGNFDKKVEDIFKGIALVHRHMLDTFIKLGLEEIEALGKPFDPVFHEAAMQRHDDKHPPGTIIEVLQKGYLLRGKVIRHSVIVVSKKE